MTWLTNIHFEKGKVRSAQTSCRTHAKETAMTSSAPIKNEELTSDELDRVTGGIIIVGGLQQHLTSALERVALNPQPLPPRVFSFHH